MAEVTKEQVKAFLDKMTVVELAEFTKELEDSWGVTAAAPMAMAMPMAGGAPEAKQEEEQTEFNVILASVGPQKIQVIKIVRELTGLGLKEAKDVVDGAPSPIKEGVSKEEAKDMKEKLEAVGAAVEVK